jgi:hypothetical protein
MSLNAILAFLAGMALICILLVIFVFIPDPSSSQLAAFRIFIALAGAAFAAAIPGFIEVQLGRRTKYVRAGGALAVLVLLYLFDPIQSIKSNKVNTTSGPNSPIIQDNSAPVIIHK